MNKDSDWVILGKFGRPQGLKGLVRVISFTDPESSILTYTGWHMQQNNQWIPLALVKGLTQNQSILVQVEGYTQREDVALLTHKEIGIPRSLLPQLPTGEYYWHELQQMRVLNEQGIELGVVTDILPTGANDVLVVSGEKRHLIPYIMGLYVLSIDTTLKQIQVNWDENF